MKRNSNKSITLFLLIIISFLPIIVFGDNTINTTTNNFCSNISNISEKLTAQIKTTEEKQSKKETNRVANTNKKENDTNSRNAISKINIDANHIKNWNKATETAKTDEQRVAVATYKVAIQTAIDTRKISVNAAIKTYKSGLMVDITAYNNSLITAITNFKSSIDTALNSAKTDCDNNVSSKIVNESFNKKVIDAKAVLKTTRKEAEISSGIILLKKTRDDSIKSAETTFKSTIDKDLADLLIILQR